MPIKTTIIAPERASGYTDENGNAIYLTESWCCVDCGFNTAPGAKDRAEMLQVMKAATSVISISNEVSGSVNFSRSEVYQVRKKVWQRAGMKPTGGCLCIGCLERRIGRKLTPKDFPPNDAFNVMPGTPRLMNRRGQAL